MYPKMNLWQSHGTFVAPRPQDVCHTSAGQFSLCQDTHTHTHLQTAAVQAFISKVNLAVH